MSFEEHVERALDELPPHLARALENLVVVVEDEDPDDPELFGLWQAQEFLPDKITIFRKPARARRFRIGRSWKKRSGSPSCTSWRTTSGSTRTGWTSSDTRRNIEVGPGVLRGMRTLNEIRQEIDRLSERRVDVMRALSEGYDATLKAEHLDLEERIAQLWEEQRHARAMLRHGDRDAIIQRARQDERLSRAA